MKSTSDRSPYLDIARGMAIVGMMIEHLIPTQGAKTLAGQWVTHVATWFTGKSAPLFFVLVGASLATQLDGRPPKRSDAMQVAFRAMSLVGLGLALHFTIWSTEVLLAIGCALPIAWLANRGGNRGLVLGSVLCLAAIPVIHQTAIAWTAADWNESGEPLLTLGSALRLIFIDGCYPLIPWLALVFSGALLSRTTSRSIWLPLSFASLAGVVSLTIRPNEAQGPSLWSMEWVPTSLPFLLVNGGIALALVSALRIMPERWSNAAPAQWLSNIGRMSLTHYLGHILLVILALRHWYPSEEWPTRVGLLALMTYLAFAVTASTLWLRRFPRGPVEMVLAALSHPRRLNHGS